MRLLDACTPTERAEVLRLIRGRMIESRKGVLTREDLAHAVAEAPNLNQAAEQLGVSRRTLQYHMRLFGMPRGRPGAQKKAPPSS